jgi:hypothetical protein
MEAIYLPCHSFGTHPLVADMEIILEPQQILLNAIGGWLVSG